MRTVAIVGRPNVGKSALFNRLARKQVSLVFDRPGTTRDRLITTCRWRDYEFDLIDTGGIGLEDQEGFGEAIAKEADLALAAATDILFVVDARAGVLPLDREVAKRLRKSNHRIIVVANKVDDPKTQSFIENEFSALGFGEVFPVSAAHGIGIDDLLSHLVASWPASEKKVEVERSEETAPYVQPIRIAIVGRPNVGKSSLINALIHETRTLVSPVPGTTRDAVDVSYTWKDREFILVDTAGMRQKRRIDDQLESAMASRSAHAINKADVCVIVLDAETGVSMQDKKIAGLVNEADCPCLIAVNKWDLAREKGDASKSREREYYDDVHADLFFLHYAPVLFLSAKTGERIDGLMKMILTIEKNRHYRFHTGPLNRVLNQAMQKQVPPQRTGGRRFKILYAAQEPSKNETKREIPTLRLFVNQASLLTDTYQRYLDLQLRKSFDLIGCPLKFVLKERKEMKREGSPGRRTSRATR